MVSAVHSKFIGCCDLSLVSFHSIKCFNLFQIILAYTRLRTIYCHHCKVNDYSGNISNWSLAIVMKHCCDVISMGENHLHRRGRVTSYHIKKMVIITSGNGLSPVWHQVVICSNQYWHIVNWALRNKIFGNFNQNTVIVEENAFRNVDH